MLFSHLTADFFLLNLLLKISYLNSLDLYVSSSASTTGNGTFENPYQNITQAFQNSASQSNLTVILLSNALTYVIDIELEVICDASILFMTSNNQMAVLDFQSSGSLNLNGFFSLVFENLTIQTTTAQNKSKMIYAMNANSLVFKNLLVRNIKNTFLAIDIAQMLSFTSVQFSSLILSNENLIEIKKTLAIKVDNCIFGQIYLKNSFLIFSFDSPLVFTNTKFNNNTIENNNGSSNLAFFRVGSSLNICNSTFSQNNLKEASLLISENDNSLILKFINVSNIVLFSNNSVLSQTDSSLLKIINANLSIFFSNNVTFYQNLAMQGLLTISKTNSIVQLSELYLIQNFGSDLISLTLTSNITLTNFKCLYTNNFLSPWFDMQSFIVGNCLTVTDYLQIYMQNCLFSNNFAISTATGLILQHTSDAKLLGTNNFEGTMDNFTCSNNYVLPSNEILINSGNCIVLWNYGILTISNGLFSNNSVDYVPSASFSGNPCLISHNTNNNLTIINTQFKANQAYCQCACLNFDGAGLIITNSSFSESISTKLDSKNGPTYSLYSEGGSMNLGAQNITFQDVVIFNSSALKGAGMFIHNRNSKAFQTMYANRLRILYNQGFQTSGFEMDATLLLGTFFFLNCDVIGNTVEFYGVLSTFYYTAINVYFYYSNISENYGKSVGAAFSFCHFSGNVFLNKTLFMNNVLNESVFIGGAAFFVYGFATTTLIYVNDCIFINNYCSLKGGAIQVAYGKLYLQDSVFLNNYALIGGGISVNVFCLAEIQNAVFKDQYNVNQGGGIHFADFAFLKLTNTTFINCQARQGGGIYIEGSQMIQSFENITFIGLQASEGAAIWMKNPNSTSFYFKNMLIINSSSTYSLITIDTATLNMSNVSMSNCIGRSFIMTQALVVLQRITVLNQSCPNKDFQGCFAFITQDCSLLFQDTLIQNITSQFIEDVFSIASSKISIINASIQNYTGKSYTAFITATDSTILVNVSSISDLQNGLIQAQKSMFQLINSKFSNITCNSNFGVIYLLNGLQFSLNNSNFSNIQGNIGGCLALVNGMANQKHEINNVIAKNCVSLQGAVLFVSGQNVNISNSTFTNNKAIESGGCIYFDCLSTKMNQFLIFSTKFTQNYAKQGGAFHSTKCIPKYDKNTVFMGNTAVYGHDFSAFPIKLTLEINDTLLNCNINPNSCYIKQGITSGQLIPALVISVLDYYNQKMTLLDGLGFLNLDNSEPNYYHPQNANYSVRLDATFKGVGTQKLQNGSFNFTEANILSQPPSLALLKVKTDLISTFSEDLLDIDSFFDKKDKSTGEYYFIFPVNIRNCVAGEIYLENSTQCLPCSKFTYSFFPTDKVCKKCPRTATCDGMTQFSVIPGYWRPSFTSDDVYQCNILSEACLGGVNSECLHGYTGIICGSCTYNEIDKFFKKGAYFCEPCLNVWIYILTAAFVIVGLFCLLFFLISTKKGSEMQNYVLMKILMSHIQTISFVSNIKINFPQFFTKFSMAQAPASNFDSVVFTVECFKDIIGVSNFQTKLFLSILFPVFVTFFIILFYSILGHFRNKSKLIIKENIVKALVITGCFFQATFINFYIKNLSCDTIANTSYLTDNLNQECWDESFTLNAILIIFPCLLFWMVLFPMMFLIYMILNRRNLDAEKVKYITRFFQAGYRKETFFWEFVHISRQSLIILVSTFVRNNPNSAVYILFFLIFFYLILQVVVMPFYDTPDFRFNLLEVTSLVACLTCYYSAIFYLRVFKESSRNWFLVLLLISNGIFFAFWVKTYLTFVKKKLATMLRTGVSMLKNASKNSIRKKTSSEISLKLKSMQSKKQEIKNVIDVKKQSQLVVTDLN